MASSSPGIWSGAGSGGWWHEQLLPVLEELREGEARGVDLHRLDEDGCLVAAGLDPVILERRLDGGVLGDAGRRVAAVPEDGVGAGLGDEARRTARLSPWRVISRAPRAPSDRSSAARLWSSHQRAAAPIGQAPAAASSRM